MYDVHKSEKLALWNRCVEMGSCKDDRVQVRWYCHHHHHHHKPAGIWLPWSVHARMGAEVVFRESIRTILSHLVNHFPFGHKNHICKRLLNSCLTTSFWWRVEVRLRVRRVVLTVEVKLTSPPRESMWAFVLCKVGGLQETRGYHGWPSKRRPRAKRPGKAAELGTISHMETSTVQYNVSLL